MNATPTFRATVRDLVVPFVLIALIGALLIGGMVVVAAWSQDRLAADTSVQTVRVKTAQLRQSLNQIVFDSSYGDQAVDNLVRNPNRTWADENIGPYLSDTYRIDSSFVVDPGNEVRYGFPRNLPSGNAPFARFSGGFDILVDRARQTAPDATPVPVEGVLRDGEVLHVATASVLTTYRHSGGREVSEGTGWVLVATIALTPERLAEIAASARLPGISVAPPGQTPSGPHIPLILVDGNPAGYLTWNAPTPGRKLLRWLLPSFALVLLSATGLAVVFCRRAIRTARELEHQTASALVQKNRAETLLAVVGTMIVALDREARVTLINNKGCEILGYSYEEMIGASWFESFVVPEERETARESFLAIISGEVESANGREVQVLTKSGERRLLVCRKNAIRAPDGTVSGTLCSAEDITERRQTASALRDLQVRFQAILDYSPSAIFLKDLNGRFLFASKEFARRGNIAASDVPGKTDYDFLDAEEARKLEASDQEIIATGGVRQIEMVVATPDGERTIISLRFPVLDSDGKMIGIGGIGTDITERQEAEIAAKKLQSELAHVLRIGTVGEMATGLAHELNQPLTAIKNYVTGMVRRLRSDGAKPEEMTRVLEIVASQAQRAGDIVRGIRHLVQREEGAHRETDINAAVREVAGLLTNEAIAKDVVIDLELDQDLPTVQADAVQIQQVILNLARNAMEAMAEGQVDRSARRLIIRSAHDDVRTILISVQDTGPGISERVSSRVFDPFFTTRASGMGMGMGLPICRTIIEAHAGNLWFNTVTGAGTTFYFSLPADPIRKTPIRKTGDSKPPA